MLVARMDRAPATSHIGVYGSSFTCKESSKEKVVQLSIIWVSLSHYLDLIASNILLMSSNSNLP